MELLRANQTQLSTHSSGPSKQAKIKILLAKLAVRRQAQIGEAEYGIYSEDLDIYSLPDIEAALELIANKSRREGETAFPDVETIREAVRAVIRSSRPSADEESATRWLQYLENCKSEGVEKPDTETLARIEKLNGKFGLEKPKEIITTCTELVCPGCGLAQPVAGNIRLWTPEQLHEHANLLEELAVIAERNRNMPRLPLGDVVEA